jgi:hypothetical protein
VPGEGVGVGAVDDGTQDERDDDGVVAVAENGDEVGDEVDGQDELAQQPEADPDAPGQVGISGQPAQQPDHVG